MPRSSSFAMNTAEIIAELHSLGSQATREGMARFGIQTQLALGVSMPSLRHLARRVGKPVHALAQELWETGLHEARILATMVDDPRALTAEQMERWVAEFDSWDLCDQCWQPLRQNGLRLGQSRRVVQPRAGVRKACRICPHRLSSSP